MKYALAALFLIAFASFSAWAGDADATFPKYGLQLIRTIRVKAEKSSKGDNSFKVEAGISLIDPIGGASGKVVLVLMGDSNNILIKEKYKYETTFEMALSTSSATFEITIPSEVWVKVKKYDFEFAPKKIEQSRIAILDKQKQEEASPFKEELSPVNELILEESIKQGAIEITGAKLTVKPEEKNSMNVCYINGKINVKNSGTKVANITIEPVFLTEKRTSTNAKPTNSRGSAGTSIEPGETMDVECNALLMKNQWKRVRGLDLKVKIIRYD